MLQSIVKRSLRPRRSFTILETVISSVIIVFVFLGSWGIFNMAQNWWHETAPMIEAQRIARSAITSIIDGSVDTTAGSISTYPRRDGIAWAVYDPVISSNITTDDMIEFGLEKEKEYFADYPVAHNVRAFYMGTDASGSKAVYYRNNASNVSRIETTGGITGLKFEKTTDDSGKVYVSVTATVEKDIAGTRHELHHIKVEYKDGVYLRNYI